MDTCSQCGKCAEVCPAQCIVIDSEIADGFPHIIARTSPCVVCSDLSCMKNCPSGALRLVAAPEEIRMGLAEVDQKRCLRHPGKAAGTGGDDFGEASGDASGGASGGASEIGEDCRLCLTTCPFGEKAIGLDAAGQVEVRAGCTGCGLCERACPTEPASIWVEPAEAMEGDGDYPLDL